ncbi:sigma 54-interacting transcriptional regulator [Clostridiaceae bacterium 35-E11]
MLENKSYIKQFTELMAEGFIFIDTQGIIQVYNNKAKEIFGIVSQEGIGHEAGKINAGDIVIIADNAIGKDDGGLMPEDLMCIGVDDQKIHREDAFIGIGAYKNSKIKPVYKSLAAKNHVDHLTLDTVFQDIHCSIQIDFVKHLISIRVLDQTFSMSYFNAIGHIVIVDKDTPKIKFYQAVGYTARGESIANLLLGKSFHAKGKKQDILDVLGKNIFEIHERGDTIQVFYEVAKGMDIRYKDKFTEINGFPTLCTLVPVSIDGKRVGAALKVEDISMLKKVIKERDEALFQIEKIEEKMKEEKRSQNLFSEILGESEAINHVKKLAYKASRSNSTVLILGESGTGKSLLAKAIHRASAKKDHPFIHVNCGAIPEQLLESELFGYEKGAFTGARNEGKIGFFELAQGGTIFLDEIAEISLSLQVKLLKVLQSKTFFRVGGTKEIFVDVRIITATNKNLEEEMQKGRFRDDLYYRIHVFPIWVPPLRERKQDIHFLVHKLLPEICYRLEYDEKRISGEALYRLAQYEWPGNVRELENILEQAVNLTEGNIIGVKHLMLHKHKRDRGKENSHIQPLKHALQAYEKKVIEETLRYYDGNRTQAMKALQIGKTSFYEKLKQYHIK